METKSIYGVLPILLTLILALVLGVYLASQMCSEPDECFDPLEFNTENGTLVLVNPTESTLYVQICPFPLATRSQTFYECVDPGQSVTVPLPSWPTCVMDILMENETSSSSARYFVNHVRENITVTS